MLAGELEVGTVGLCSTLSGHDRAWHDQVLPDPSEKLVRWVKALLKIQSLKSLGGMLFQEVAVVLFNHCQARAREMGYRHGI